MMSAASFFSWLGNGIKTAAETVYNKAVQPVVGEISNIQNQAALALDPTYKQAKDSYDSAQATYNAEQTTANTTYSNYLTTYDNYANYSGYATLLFLNYSVLKYTETQFNRFMKETATVPPGATLNPFYAANVNGSLAVQISAKLFNHLLHGTLIAKKLNNNGLVIDPPTLSPTVLGTVAGSLQGVIGSAPADIINTVTLLTNIDSIGPMAVNPLNLLVDALTGAAEYNKGTSAYNSALTSLTAHVGVMNQAISNMNTAISGIKSSFMTLCATLNGIQKATFNYKLPITATNKDYFTSMQAAVEEYLVITQIKHDWINFRSRNPNGTVAQFIGCAQYLLKYHPAKNKQLIDAVAAVSLT
jgi:hypothetical protein